MIQDKTQKRVVGVDITLNVTTCAIVDIRGNIIATDSFQTSGNPNISDFVSKICECIMALAEKNGGYESIRSIGISVSSGNYQSGCIENAPNMPWKGVIPLAAMLRDRLGIAVAVANNAHAMALGEHAFGAAHGMKDFIVISLGAGMGSCFFCNGQPHLGNNGFAGEIGHSCAIHNGRQCGCGNRGCLETYTATKGILLTAKEVMEESDKPSLMRQTKELSPKIIAAFCDQGDELAIETYRRTGQILGLGLANYASILNPEAIIFTGSVSQAGKWLLEPATEAFEEHVFRNITGSVKFLLSSLENQVRNVLGASVLAWEVKEYSLFK